RSQRPVPPRVPRRGADARQRLGVGHGAVARSGAEVPVRRRRRERPRLHRAALRRPGARRVRPHRAHGGRVQVDPQHRHRPGRQPLHLGGRVRSPRAEIRAHRRRVLNPLKEKLARGELAASMTVRLVSSVEIVRIAKTAGFDAIYVDLEHSAFSLETTGQIAVMALEAGVPALVRVPARTPEYISRVLDAGALGVIAPGVGSASEAQEVVAAAKYPPLGSRGLSTGLAHLGFRSVPAAEALPKMNDATMVIVQLESAAG